MSIVLGDERIPLIREAETNEEYESLDAERVIDEEEEELVWLQKYIQSNQQLHWLRRPSPKFMCILVFVFTLATACGDATKEVVILKLACNSLINSNGYCNPNDTQILVSNFKMAKLIISSIIMLFSTPRIGYLSDRYGRSKFIALCIATTFLHKLLEYLLVVNFSYFRFWLMVVVNLIPALAGGSIALSFLAMCYINDVVEPTERIHWLGITSSFMFIGGSLGPLIGNYLQSLGDKYQQPMDNISLAMISISKLAIYSLRFEVLVLAPLTIFLIFFTPESRSERSRRKSIQVSQVEDDEMSLRYKNTPTYQTYLNSLNTFKSLKHLIPTRNDVPSLPRFKAAAIILVFIDCILISIITARSEVMLIYGILKFKWNEKDVGNAMAVEYSSNAVSLILISPILTRVILQKFCKFKSVPNRLDMIDFSMLCISLLAETIFNFWFAIANTKKSALADMAIFSSLGALLMPAMTSSVIKFYDPSKTGEILGILGFVKNIFTLLMTYVVISIYQYFVKLDKPGFLFISLSVVTGFSLLCVVIIKILLGLDSKIQPQVSRKSSRNFDLSIA